ncbi:MAG TPA: prolyl oligopeptidase family serine peptidase, partial [Gemmataceae bacterium]|nr:prolyl oligopeptidase family serine peptidase [Gemmataceae bacterium]
MPAFIARRSVAVAAVCAAICSTLVARCSVRALADEPGRPRELQRYVPTAEDLRAGSQPQQRPGQTRAPIYKDRITPHWFHGSTRFWYRNDLRDGAREFVLVDAERGTRQPAFDHAKLAVSLSKASGTEYKADRLPFDEIEFVNDEKAIRLKVGQTRWECNLATYECSKMEEGAKPEPVGWVESSRPATSTVGLEDSTHPTDLTEPMAEPSLLDPPRFGDEAPQQDRPNRGQRAAGPSPKSPDGKWTAFVKEHDLYIRANEGGKEILLSHDGKEGLAYGFPSWAPDSKTVAAFRVEPGDRKEVYLIESSPRGGGRAKLHQRSYDLPGDKLATYELNLFQIDDPKPIKPQVERGEFGHPDYGPSRLHWSKDGSRVAFEKVDRGHQRFRMIEVDARTGEGRNLIDEKSETFIWTAHAEMLNLQRVNWLQKTDEIIYVSERDGWRHLYLIDAREGKVKNQVTRGDWAVRGIDRIDEDSRQVWFRATGKIPGQDPYLVHYCRVNFDGTNLVTLTEGNGSHSAQYSPDRKYLIDTYSRADVAPVHELRRGDDGKFVCALEKADIADLEASGWKPPEVFVAKGRDGKTDIWGIICRPRDFDPKKNYPVIESIYAGPHGAHVPKAFSGFRRFSNLTDLGFIVVQVDGMGTANRSKAFHDICWKNLKDAGFPDRMLWHRAVAEKYPYYDISRVGIYGTSAGGQNATGALLFHPDFYKAGVSACGCHDNRMDKASWNEQWMGYPVGSQYAECSNIDNAHRLRGKLLLIVGELDDNVPPESTYRLVDALVKAGKDFEFLAVPGMRHSNGGAYGVRRMQDFFVRHLHGVEPSARNGSGEAPPLTPTPLPPGERGRGEGRLSEELPKVSAPPESFFEKVREKDREAARQFYKKFIDVKGMPVVAAAEVADEALQRTYYLVTHLLAGRPDILEAMVKNGTRLIVIGKEQVYTDMPEYR